MKSLSRALTSLILTALILLVLTFSLATAHEIAARSAAAQPPLDKPTPAAPPAEAPEPDNAGVPLSMSRPVAPAVLSSRAAPRPQAVDALAVDVWYEPDLKFGHVGNPQTWVNILGNVSEADAQLSYSLNGGSVLTVSVGPDDRRLQEAGDFNIELDYETLVPLTNTVIITATTTGEEITKTVTFPYTANQTWPASYTADWSSAPSIHEIAQVVDGKWEIQLDGTLRPVELGYDRLVAIGDHTSWTDYEVEVPVTIHGIDGSGFGGPSIAPGVGLIVRWQGHYEHQSRPGEQPFTGWAQNLGALAWYRWYIDSSNAGLQMIGHANMELDVSADKELVNGETYIYKMSVQSVRGQSGTYLGGIYRFKVWQEGTPEPVEWDLIGNGRRQEPQTGSLLLVAHHVDASFGTVTVTPLDSMSFDIDTTVVGSGTVERSSSPPYDYGEQVTLTAVPQLGHTFDGWSGDLSGSDNPVTVTVTQDLAITATFAAASNKTLTLSGDGNGTIDVDPPQPPDGYLHGRVITLTAVPNSGYAFSAWGDDLSGSDNPATLTMDADKSVSASFVKILTPVSDDFNSCTLDTNRWSVIDPLGDATVTMNGLQVLISVPGGTAHDLWDNANDAPRLMTVADDMDLEVIAKFDSAVTQSIQMQGIIIQQDSDNFLRFDFFRQGTSIRVFAAIFTGGSPGQTFSENIAITEPYYMRVKRVNDQWSQDYSSDGETWTRAATFEHPLTVTAAGVFAGNSGNNPPAFTAAIDYFFNAAQPIDPEDADLNTISTSVTGNGVISKSPDKPSYLCHEEVSLQATGAPGWVFKEWGGSLAGNQNPATLTISGDHTVTATFVEAGEKVYLPFIGQQ